MTPSSGPAKTPAPPSRPTSTLTRSRRRALLSVVAAVLLAVLSLAVGILVGPTVRSPAQAVADAAPPAASPITALAERRVLAEPLITRGTVRPGASVEVAAPVGLSGDAAVVTRVTVSPGTRVREGAVLAEISGAPLFGLVLPFPLYRDLGQGAQGPDVTAVQRALRRLGTGAQVSGVYDESTTRAVNALYRQRGYDPPTSLRRTDVVALDRAGRTVSAVRVRVGTVLREPDAVLLALDTAAVTVQATVARKLSPGTPAEILDETQGARLPAVVRDVADRPGAEGYAVTLTFTGAALAPGGDRTVLVTVQPARDTEAVLAVPVAAVYTRADAVTFVTVEGEGRRTADVVVETGRSAGGWVQVTPKGGRLGVGARVVVGESALKSGRGEAS